MIKTEWICLRYTQTIKVTMARQFCEHVFLNALSVSDEELTTKQITDVVGCSVQHGINMLKWLKDEEKIEGRQLATKAFLWRRK